MCMCMCMCMFHLFANSPRLKHANAKSRLQATLPFTGLQTRLRLPCARANRAQAMVIKPASNMQSNSCRAHVHQPTPCPPLRPMCNRLNGQRVEPLKEAIGASRAGGGPASAADARQFTCAWQATGRAHARACNRQLSYGRGTRI